MAFREAFETAALRAFDDGGAGSAWTWLKPHLAGAGWEEAAWTLDWLKGFGGQGEKARVPPGVGG
jgi:hypothetical protein